MRRVQRRVCRKALGDAPVRSTAATHSLGVTSRPRRSKGARRRESRERAQARVDGKFEPRLQHDVRDGNAKDPHLSVGVFQEIPAATYSPKEEPLSTIGAGGLDCCVRNGNRYISTAITTGKLLRSATCVARTGIAGSPSVLERARTSNSKPSAD